MINTTVVLAVLTTIAAAPVAAQHPGMPPGLSHEEHLRQMQKDEELARRGALAMGFDQDAAIHHFLLQPSGGTILVRSKDPGDARTIAEVREHFREIAAAFQAGAFDKPLATHGEMPPGAETMATRKDRIRYRYDERADGAGLVIETSDAAALAAIHEFLRYQIVEHKTGDPLTVPQ
jgi:hypothetical protein